MAQEPFSFAGFEFPRRIPQLVPLDYCGAPSPYVGKIMAEHADRTRAALAGEVDTAELQRRVSAFRRLPRYKVATDYYGAPESLTRETKEFGFYLDSDFMPRLRWQWADQCEGVRIDHNGWFADDMQDSTIRGLVLRLPRGRGFLAGWSLGSGMSATVSRSICADESDAAREADHMAERAAEKERDHQTGWRAGEAAAEADRESRDARADALALLADIKRTRRNLAGEAGETVCAALRARVESLIETWRDKRDERDRLADEWTGHAGFAETYGER